MRQLPAIVTIDYVKAANTTKGYKMGQDNVTDGPDVQVAEKLWDVRSCAAYLDVASSTLRRMVERANRTDDGIPYVWISGMIRFDPPTIRAWTARQKAKPAPETKPMPDEAA